MPDAPEPEPEDRGPTETPIESLLGKYLPDLTAYVDRHAGAVLQQKESRSDLVQSVCREVLEELRAARLEYRGEAQFRQWLYQAALHKIQGRGRYFAAERRAAAREVPLADLGSAGEPPADASAAPSRAMAKQEERERFRAAMAQLDATSRDVVEWSYFEDVPHKEIARRLAITEAHSRVLLARALARIARIATDGSV
jgi:RNA polymerase sigma factor (sigma-70 family)